MSQKQILIVDDEKEILSLLEFNLIQEGFRVVVADSGEEGLKVLAKTAVDLLVLDLMLPGIDGLEVCRIVRQDKSFSQLPIIILTAKGDEADVIVGLKLGADDYLLKPFSVKVLLERIRSLLRRASFKEVSSDVRLFERLKIDLLKYKVICSGQSVDLTTIEFNILEFLSRSPGRVFTRDQIVDNVWKEGKFIVDRAVDVHVRALRQKLGEAANIIETVRGVGYRFQEADSIYE